MTAIVLRFGALAVAVALSLALSLDGMHSPGGPIPAADASSLPTPAAIESLLNPTPPGVGFPHPPRVELLADGRNIQLLENFEYADLRQRSWIVPRGYISNGASVPQILWSANLAPLTGKYRDASILHDYLCQLRVTPTSEETHLLFYEAMRVSGVDRVTAYLFWDTVSWFGPHWQRAKAIRSPDCVRRAAYPEEVEGLLREMSAGRVSSQQASVELQRLKAKYSGRSRTACKLQP